MCGTRSVPRLPTTPMEASTSGWMFSIPRTGEPSVTMPLTRSGRRTATARAMIPPRLWPTIATRWPVDVGHPLQALHGAAHDGPEQSTLTRMPGAPRAVAERAQPAGHEGERAVAGEVAGDRRTGRSSPGGRPMPFQTGERISVAASSPIIPSRQSGGMVGRGRWTSMRPAFSLHRATACGDGRMSTAARRRGVNERFGSGGGPEADNWHVATQETGPKTDESSSLRT